MYVCGLVRVRTAVGRISSEEGPFSPLGDDVAEPQDESLPLRTEMTRPYIK